MSGRARAIEWKKLEITFARSDICINKKVYHSSLFSSSILLSSLLSFHFIFSLVLHFLLSSLLFYFYFFFTFYFRTEYTQKDFFFLEHFCHPRFSLPLVFSSLGYGQAIMMQLNTQHPWIGNTMDKANLRCRSMPSSMQTLLSMHTSRVRSSLCYSFEYAKHMQAEQLPRIFTKTGFLSSPYSHLFSTIYLCCDTQEFYRAASRIELIHFLILRH